MPWMASSKNCFSASEESTIKVGVEDIKRFLCDNYNIKNEYHSYCNKCKKKL